MYHTIRKTQWHFKFYVFLRKEQNTANFLTWNIAVVHFFLKKETFITKIKTSWTIQYCMRSKTNKKQKKSTYG